MISSFYHSFYIKTIKLASPVYPRIQYDSQDVEGITVLIHTIDNEMAIVDDHGCYGGR